MNKQDFLKIQTCVLKVNIHCEGCKHKVKKILQKIDGVYTTSVDSEQGKVTVTGNADPATLIKKLEKSGKHAELWGGKPIMDNFKAAGGKDPKSAKGGGGHAQEPLKGGGGGGGLNNNQQAMLLLQQKLQQMNGAKQMMGSPKDQKSVKFSMPEDEFDDESGDDEDDDYDDEDDEGYDSEFDDEDEDDEDDDDDELEHHMPMPMPNKNNNNKMAPNIIGGGKGHGGGPMDAIMNGHAMINDNKGGKKGGGGGGGVAVDLPMVMKSKGGGDTDWDGKKGGGKEKDKSSKGLFGFLGAANKKSKDSNTNSKGFKDGGGKGGGGGGDDDNWSKKGGGKTHHDMNKMKNESHEIQVKAKQSKGGNGNGNENVGKMGKGEMYESIPIPAVQGLPAPINGGYHPYNQQQQQYMAMMMNHHQQQQQRPYGNEMYQPMMYSRPPPSVTYGPPMPPPVPVDPYSTYFSDDNTNSCAVM